MDNLHSPEEYNYDPSDLERYYRASQVIEATSHHQQTVEEQMKALESRHAVEIFQKQLDLLKERLFNNPAMFRSIFIEEGIDAIAAEFKKEEMSSEFVHKFWTLLLQGDAMSIVLMRFVWDVPLKFKRRFITAIDKHLSDRYPMFKGLSQNWPSQNNIPPYIRPADERNKDFDLVNQGYLGYMGLGYSFREVELFVWLEVLRDKQCDDRPCEIGISCGKPEPKGGCPVKIHIPEMLHCLGEGRFEEAYAIIRDSNPLPNVTGRVCPQEHQCQGVCTLAERPMEIGQVEWYLPQSRKVQNPDALFQIASDYVSPWKEGKKPPIAVVGSGPAGMINAYLLLKEGFPVTVFEAFHELGGVLRYGIPEFRLPNELIDDVIKKIKQLGGEFVTNFLVGKTATLAQLKEAGFWKIFVGTGAGLPKFLNVPGEHLNGVMSANEFLTRVNLMQAHKEDYETPLPDIDGKKIIVIGGGNTAMDAVRTAKRLGGDVTIVYRRTREEMPVRVEELHHALEEGIALKVLRTPIEFRGDSHHFVKEAVLDVMTLGEPDASGRRSPVHTGHTETIQIDLAIMALGNTSNPIVKDAEPGLRTTKWGSIEVKPNSQETSIDNVFSGGDAARGGSTAIKAAGDGLSAAREINANLPEEPLAIRKMISKAIHYTRQGQAKAVIREKRLLADGIVEFVVESPLIARSARAGQFVRVLAWEKGELIPLTLADWDARRGTITLVVQGLGTSSIVINNMAEGEAFHGIAGPLGLPSHLQRYENGETVVFTAGGVGLPPVYPIMREHLQMGNHVTLISGFRSKGHIFWSKTDERVGRLQARYPNTLDVIYTTNDGSMGFKGFVTGPLLKLLEKEREGQGRKIGEVVTIGPPLMMRAVSDLTRPFGVRTIASLNSIMVDATGMCGACMVPVTVKGKMVRKHACIDGPELDAHIIDWEKFMPRFMQFRTKELKSMEKHGLKV
ncbi:MAG: sulfide/dihydroorotate dehydrogenase-like FAD/NAD-binding protein [Magnetococcales bacterium]|nr:sulfide/dihydroorotate dehydrogenase-like FAD/NAD-binding protein [Magnetococcales bacterium]